MWRIGIGMPSGLKYFQRLLWIEPTHLLELGSKNLMHSCPAQACSVHMWLVQAFIGHALHTWACWAWLTYSMLGFWLWVLRIQYSSSYLHGKYFTYSQTLDEGFFLRVQRVHIGCIKNYPGYYTKLCLCKIFPLPKSPLSTWHTIEWKPGKKG